MVSFRKSGSTRSVVECSNVSCSPLDPLRLTVFKSIGGFDITISLNNLDESDSGNYNYCQCWHSEIFKQ